MTTQFNPLSETTTEKVKKLLDSWNEYLTVQRNLSPKTVSSYMEDMKSFFDFLFRSFNQPADEALLRDLTVTDFRSFLAWRHQNQADRSTVARGMSALKNFFKYLMYQNILKNYQEILNTPKPKRDKESRVFVVLLLAFIVLLVCVFIVLWEYLDSSAPLEDENLWVASLIFFGGSIFFFWGLSLFSSPSDKDSRYQLKQKLYAKQYAELRRLFVQHKMYMIDVQTQYRTNREMMQKVKEIDREVLKLKKTYAIKDI